MALLPASTPVLVPTPTVAPATEQPITTTTVITPAMPVTATIAITTAAPVTATVAVTTAAPVTTTPVTTTTAATTATGTTIAADSPWGTILNAQLVERVAMEEINNLSAGFYPASNLVDAQYAVDVYRLTVQSSDELGEPIELQTDLYLPRVAAETSFPVLAYAPGTTGLGDGCAPSQEYLLGRQWGSYRTHMLSYAGQGFIGVLPDGLSYNDADRPHEYFIAELEAHTLLDAARAAYRFLAEPPPGMGARPQDALFFAGYSNGGHTAFAAKDFAADYAPELPVRGVISHGATTNVEALMRESPIFTPYLIYAYRHFFGAEVIGPEDVFLEHWLPSFDQDAQIRCVDDIFIYYTNDPQGMYRADFRTALFNGQLGDQYPLFKAVLDANYAGTFGGFDIPVVFFQGTADYVVTPASQERFATFLCEQGEPVTYATLPAVQHVYTRQVSFKATIAWMEGIANGQTPQSNCAQIIAEE
ncbi:MAG: lipase family protein [Caldilineaceae bacterium]